MRYFEEFFSNRIFFIVLFAWLLSCVIKGIIEWIRNKKINWGRFFGPGGMPSSHSTALFVVCCALALIVMYDASGIRRAAGEQAKMINMIVEAWEEKDPVLKDEKLKELLGHTPLEVLGGAVLGVFVALVSGVFLGL